MRWPEEHIFVCCLLLFAATSVVQTQSEKAPSYLLYTRRNQQSPQRIEAEVESLVRSSFFALEPIVLSIPRWQGGDSSALEHTTVVTSQLSLRACNVFAVDLNNVTDEQLIVESLSRLILLLQQHFDVPLRDFLLVGFDAGAHLAGAVGQLVGQELNQQLPHITALDPSAIGHLKHELSAADAAFVEVIHTNGENLGTLQRLGHIDYYPNGGQIQPGCGAEAASCAHERALLLALEMWSPENDFICALCSSVEKLSGSACRWSTLRMGAPETGKDQEGIYFLETQSAAPYSKGAYYISFL
ncbi:lipoprotein lipase [Scaptodrosophila lebanonensis]|uniref:Lipoprotein lipase n=1 Tax=Drosophila lebanonensis TaxID=7225 RepID=A0A6J2T9P6_DROLE|nr:lipoprotein lipase [Scaptodrosophila lebanonensis]